MREIKLNTKRHALTSMVLGFCVFILGVWLYTLMQSKISTAYILSFCVSLYGLAFFILGLKYIRFSAHPIRYGNDCIEIPEKLFSNRVLKLQRNEIISYGITYYLLPYIKSIEISSGSEKASISLDAFSNRKQIQELLTYLESGD